MALQLLDSGAKQRRIARQRLRDHRPRQLHVFDHPPVGQAFAHHDIYPIVGADRPAAGIVHPVVETERILLDALLTGKSGQIVFTVQRRSLRLLRLLQALMRRAQRAVDGGLIQPQPPGQGIGDARQQQRTLRLQPRAPVLLLQMQNVAPERHAGGICQLVRLTGQHGWLGRLLPFGQQGLYPLLLLCQLRRQTCAALFGPRERSGQCAHLWHRRNGLPQSLQGIGQRPNIDDDPLPFRRRRGLSRRQLPLQLTDFLRLLLQRLLQRR